MEYSNLWHHLLYLLHLNYVVRKSPTKTTYIGLKDCFSSSYVINTVMHVRLAHATFKNLRTHY